MLPEAERQSRSAWPRRIVVAGLVWASVLVAGMLATPDAADRATGLGILLSGAYALLFLAARRWWRRSSRPRRRAISLGCANAAVVETLFLVAERSQGAEGVAAHPNLLLDLLITMPWYAGLVVLFVGVQERRKFSPWTVALLGGLYEVPADGILGAAFSGALFDPVYLVLLPTVAFWLFVPVYAAIVVPAGMVMETVRPTALPPKTPVWRDAIRPMKWILPFAASAATLLIVISLLED